MFWFTDTGLATAARLLAIGAQIILAARILQLRLARRYPILLAACLFGAVTALALMPYPTSSRAYWEPWWKVQFGVILFHSLIALEVAIKSSESAPKLGKATISVLIGLLVISGILTIWSKDIDGIPFTFVHPVNAAVLLQRHTDGALGLWVMLFAWFYWSSADVGERANVIQYRRWMAAFFVAEAISYVLILNGYKQALTAYSILALLVMAGCFTKLALVLTSAGEAYSPNKTKFSGMSDDDLGDNFSKRPHRR